MTIKKNIIVIGIVALFFSIIFDKALHHHSYEHHYNSTNNIVLMNRIKTSVTVSVTKILNEKL